MSELPLSSKRLVKTKVLLFYLIIVCGFSSIGQSPDSVQYTKFGNVSDGEGLQKEYKLSGTVINANTGQGLTGVTIAVEKLGQGTFSKSQGRYTLKLPSGSHFNQGFPFWI